MGEIFASYDDPEIPRSECGLVITAYKYGFQFKLYRNQPGKLIDVILVGKVQYTSDQFQTEGDGVEYIPCA